MKCNNCNKKLNKSNKNDDKDARVIVSPIEYEGMILCFDCLAFENQGRAFDHKLLTKEDFTLKEGD